MVSHYTSPFPGIAHWASLWVRPKPKEKERRKKEVTFIRSTWTEVNFVNMLVTILQKRYASWLERHLRLSERQFQAAPRSVPAQCPPPAPRSTHASRNSGTTAHRSAQVDFRPAPLTLSSHALMFRCLDIASTKAQKSVDFTHLMRIQGVNPAIYARWPIDTPYTILR